MKILYFSPHPHLNLASPAGYATHMREIISGFKKLNHSVSTLIAGGEVMGENKISAKRGSSEIKKMIPGFLKESIKDLQLMRINKKLQKQLSQVLNVENPDLIYERGYYLMDSGAKAARKFKKTYFIELNAPFPEEKRKMSSFSFFEGLAKKRLKKQLDFADRLIVVSEALKNFYVDEYKIAAEKIIVTPNAFNPDTLKNYTEAPEEVKKKVNGKTVIGFVGSIFPWHGVDELILAFSKVLAVHPNVYLLIIGGGETLPELERAAKEKNISDKILFTGNVSSDKVFGYIQLFDIAVMAKSNWYGSPVKIFEYGAMKKAIIAPNTGPVHDVLIDKVDGLLIAGVEDLEKGLLLLIEKQDLRKFYAESFFKKVNADHTWLKMSEKILSTFS